MLVITIKYECSQKESHAVVMTPMAKNDVSYKWHNVNSKTGDVADMNDKECLVVKANSS